MNTVTSEIESPEIKKTDPVPSSKLVRFFKEPLLHFLIAGAGIYLLFAWFGQSESDDALADENTIVISEGELNWLAETWQKKWNRLPTDEEMLGLVKQQLRETVLYREAMSMGLDKDDTIIRRRLAQKLEFLAQDLIQPEPPTDEQLEAYFEKNIDRYKLPKLITFTHVFLDPDKRGDQTLADAKKLKAKLTASGKAPDANSDWGDRFMLQSYYPERSQAEISKLFGGEFARSIMELEPEKWHGPVLSGYGTHLVYIQAIQEFPLPKFAPIAGRVGEDWMNEERTELNNEYIESLLKRYTVVVEGEEADDGQARVMGVSK